MTDKPETVEDVLAEMRADAESENLTMPFRMYAGGLSARIKAALKRRDEALLEVAERLEREARYGDKPGEVPRFAQDGPTSRWLEREAARIRAIVESR